MSRIGRQPVPIPEEVQVTVQEDNTVTVKGPVGQLRQQLHPDMIIKAEEGQIVVERPSDQKQHRALHGLTRSLLANMVQGAAEGFEKRLQMQGVGYRAEMDGNKLRLRVGFSHDVVVEAPEGLEITVEGNNAMIIRGADKQAVGQLAANIRAVRPVGPYWAKGTRWAGIKYDDEQLRRKPGKQAKIGIE